MVRGPPAASAASMDVDRAEHVGLDAFRPSSRSTRGNVLQRRGVEHDLQQRLGADAEDPRSIANIGDEQADRGLAAIFFLESVLNVVQGEFRLVDDGEFAGAKGQAAQRQLAADGAAATRHEHTAALHEPFEPIIIDADGRADQRVLDLRLLERGARARHAADLLRPQDRQAQTSG